MFRNRICLFLTAVGCLFVAAARASDYDSDVWDALKLLNERAGQTGMQEDDRKRYNELLTKYADERGRLMEDMLTMLAKADASDLRDNWANKNEKGKQLLERLGNDVPKIGDKEGLAAAGLMNFATGEKKIWELNAKSDVAITAEVMLKILSLDLAVIKQAEGDLKSCRDKDKAIEAQVARCENEITAAGKDFLALLAKKVLEKKLTGELKDGSAKEFAKSYIARMTKNVVENQQSAKDKHEVMGVLSQDIAVIMKAEEKLSPAWIDEVCKKGESAAKELPNAGANGDYKAADWKKFGEAASKALGEHRLRSTEQSKKVFNDLLPVFKEEVKKKFATFMDDPDKLASWETQIDEQFKSMEELLAKQEELNNKIAEGPFKAGVKESMLDLRSTLKLYWDLFWKSEKENKDEMKK